MSESEEAAVDVRVPTRRRRASDDEGEDAEFHDAAEYAASISSHPEEHAVEAHAVDVPEGDGSEEDGPGEAEPEEQTGDANEQPAGEEQDAELSSEPKKAKLREPFEVPTSGAFWLHDDRFGEEVQATPSQ
ncbi:hypothetical protein GPECTOR_4g680 [Gonium pectorale]|uniref:Btz domain-containing protein n=1 Tax=Gonium pectorale TaxID=33097 RepID=A0A150GXS1_GONPE|nr:hypothetical protein GPECTOR_4g680 [Gonium pectorale]|eukprot:KXZ54615.1 hypothetical protein GPECTOR_4g680 [Gonium pectorale]